MLEIFLILSIGLQMATFSMGNKLTMAVAGRKDAFETKAELDLLAKVILQEVVEDILLEVNSKLLKVGIFAPN